jgi:hypothetical protein
MDPGDNALGSGQAMTKTHQRKLLAVIKNSLCWLQDSSGLHVSSVSPFLRGAVVVFIVFILRQAPLAEALLLSAWALELAGPSSTSELPLAAAPALAGVLY